MTTARCPKMDDETVPIQGVLPPNCSQVVTFEDWMMGPSPKMYKSWNPTDADKLAPGNSKMFWSVFSP